MPAKSKVQQQQMAMTSSLSRASARSGWWAMPDLNGIELRFVVTPDLDGRQLQYRIRRSNDDWLPWKAVPTVFENKKAKERFSKRAKTKLDTKS